MNSAAVKEHINALIKRYTAELHQARIDSADNHNGQNDVEVEVYCAAKSEVLSDVIDSLFIVYNIVKD